MSLPTITATGRLTSSPEFLRLPDGTPVLRLKVVCEDGHRATRLPVDLLGAAVPGWRGRLHQGDRVRAAGLLTARVKRAGRLIYTLTADDLYRIDSTGEAA